MTQKTVAKAVGLLLAIVLVGVAGVLVGQLVRERLPGAKPEVNLRTPQSLLEVGQPMPDADLAAADGAVFALTDYVGRDGAVVLFVDLECPPCTDMCLRWQSAVEEGLITADRVLAITNHSQEKAQIYAADHGLTLAVVTDTEQTFRSQYKVDRFPLEVVVGASGNIAAWSYESRTSVNRDWLIEQLTK